MVPKTLSQGVIRQDDDESPLNSLQLSDTAASSLLFKPLKELLRHYLFHDNEEVEMAVCERLQMQKSCFYMVKIFKIAPRRKNANISREVYGE